MKEDDKRRLDRVMDSHFRSLYVIVRLGAKEWAIGAEQRDRLAAQADAIEPQGIKSVEDEEPTMPSVYWMRCHCCGRTFDATRRDARWCGPICRKRASRKDTGTRNRPRNKREWFRPEFKQAVPMKEDGGGIKQP